MNMEKRVLPIEIPFDIPLPNGRHLPRSVGCYLVVGASVGLIDAGVAGAWSRLKSAMRTNDMDIAALRHLVFTHAHPDHIGAAPTVVREAELRTYAHVDAVRWIEDTARQNRERPVPGFDRLVEGPVAIDKRLADGETLDLGGMHLRAVATPGHADGHLALYCPEAEALFSGDALPEPNGLPIYTDLAATLRSIRTLQGIESVKTLYSSWEKPIHGRSAIDARYAEARDWIQTIHDAVRRALPECGESNPQTLTRRVMEDLGLPSFAVNPLTAATVRAHLDHISLERISEIESSTEGAGT